MTTPALRIGTRGSALATTQTGWVADKLKNLAGLNTEQVIIRTTGDITTGSLANLGGTGVFATALRQAVVNGEVDMAVHSLKDLPAKQPDELKIAAIPERADVRDALCARDGLTLQTLPAGAKIGTGSPRRIAQIRALRPDVELIDIRGNVATRLARVAGYEHHHDHAPAAAGSPRGDLDAVVLACAGLDRLEMGWAITERLDPTKIIPAPGQGALAVEVSQTQASEETLNAGLIALADPGATVSATAERALLERLEAGCAAPIGALATYSDNTLHMQAMVASIDGTQVIRRDTQISLELGETVTADHLEQARRLGVEVAEMLVADGADLLPAGPARGGS